MAWENYPYSNFHELNLDWILKQVVEFKEEWEVYKKQIDQEISDFEEKIDKEIADFESDITQKWEEYKASLNSEWQAFEIQIEQEITNIQSDLENWKTEQESKYNEFTADIESRFSAFTNSVNSRLNQFNAKIEQIQSEWTTYQTDLNNQWDQYKASIGDEFNDYKDIMDNRYNAFTTDINTRFTNVVAKVTQLEADFNELQTHVDNFFENLNVQDEIDNKIDSMISSGQFGEIISDIVGLQSIEQFGVLTTNSAATNAANLIKALVTNKVFYVPAKTYNLGELSIDVGRIMFIGTGTFYFTSNFAVTNCIFVGLTIDSSDFINYMVKRTVHYNCHFLKPVVAGSASNKLSNVFFNDCLFDGNSLFSYITNLFFNNCIFGTVNTWVTATGVITIKNCDTVGMNNVDSTTNTGKASLEIYKTGNVKIANTNLRSADAGNSCCTLVNVDLIYFANTSFYSDLQPRSVNGISLFGCGSPYIPQQYVNSMLKSLPTIVSSGLPISIAANIAIGSAGQGVISQEYSYYYNGFFHYDFNVTFNSKADLYDLALINADYRELQSIISMTVYGRYSPDDQYAFHNIVKQNSLEINEDDLPSEYTLPIKMHCHTVIVQY